MTRARIFGYLSVSGVCMALNNVLLIVLDWAGFPLLASLAISFATVCVVGYALHSRVSFPSTVSLWGLARYSAAMSLNAPLALVAIWACRDAAGLPMILAAPLATATTTIINYGLCRWAVFGQRERFRNEAS
jgi:putative flippase GtrA